MALTVDLQPVSLGLELVLCGFLLQHRLNVAAQEVLGEAALGAYQVVVVPTMAQLIMEAAVLEQHPTQNACVHQQAEGPVHGRPAYLGDLLPQLLRGEMPG